ncbi:hypothetical protein DFH27DRAFT_547319 [Peziza echinospora]|nr:hypothetical protein DFH27DRAFT_547319 [Peziza echinospora]
MPAAAPASEATTSKGALPPPSPSLKPSSSPLVPSETNQLAIPEPEAGTFHFVVPDPVAIYYLEQDPNVTLIHERLQLEGYEIYLVEQWACSRSHPSFTIATYTGHPSHKIYVGVISITNDESQWGKQLSHYFTFVRFYGREKQTPLGTLMVTNLSSLSSDLTVIAVPDGDVAKYKTDFIVNEDLKRMGCSGRAALSLSVPTDAAQAKFHQLFRTCERIKFYDAVMELVRLCQLALVMFQKLDKHFADGLLCDETERAIKSWWAEFGTDFYNSEPLDGILGPTTVSALLGMMIGARNRLSTCGISVPKDAFDQQGFKAAIGHFQKQNKLPRTRRLDRVTVDKLHRMTTKGPSGDKYGMVPKAIKSTVAEMSGKAHKVEMETCEIEKFIMNLSGERAKYLWYGKPMKSGPASSIATSGDGGLRRNSAPVTTTPAGSGRARPGTHGKPLTLVTNVYDPKLDPIMTTNTEAIPLASHPLSAPAYPSAHYLPQSDVKDPLRKTMFKSMNNRMNDAKSGLGKIKDVATGVASGISGQVSRRHQRKQTQDNIGSSDATHSGSESAAFKNPGAASSTPMIEIPKLASPLSLTVEEASRSDPTNIHQPLFSTSYDINNSVDPVTTTQQNTSFQPEASGLMKWDSRDAISPMSQALDSESLAAALAGKKREGGSRMGDAPSTAAPSASGSAHNPEYLVEKISNFPDQLIGLQVNQDITSSLHRSQSFSQFEGRFSCHHEEYYPRRLSFSVAEDAILDWNKIGEDDTAIVTGMLESTEAMKHKVVKAEEKFSDWTVSKIHDVQAFFPKLIDRLMGLSDMYKNDVETYQQLEEISNELMPREFSDLEEKIREVELLRPKLQYEIGALQNKVEEVEEYVDGFRRQVEELERKIAALEPSTEKSGWLRLAQKWTSWNTPGTTEDPIL